MPNPELNSLDEFERFVRNTITPWSQEKRIALAAAMAERWLPVCNSFFEEYEWDDPAVFQDAVESVWNCLLGHKLTGKECRLLDKRVQKNTPHVDDYDCEEVIATSAMIGYALNCCVGADNTGDALMAMVYGFEAVAPGLHQDTHWSEIEEGIQNVFKLSDEMMESLRERMVSVNDEDPAEPDAWQSPRVQEELEKQLKLLKLVGDMGQIDKQQINALRQKLTSPDLVGTVAPRPERPKGLTNEVIFEEYRKENDGFLTNKGQWTEFADMLAGTAGMVMMYFRAWAFRYTRRKEQIDKMIDVVARQALLARYSTLDTAVQGETGWDQETRSGVESWYGELNFEFEFDVDSPEKPHSYGPSFRRLCIERRLAGDSDGDSWNSILEWACHRPTAWEEEDQRKKKKHAYAAPELAEPLSRKLSWRATDDLDHPWTTDVAGDTWRVRLNHFPDDIMYTLMINDAVVGKFHDWPECWQR